MYKLFSLLLVATILSTVSSCDQTEIIFPEVQEVENQGPIDIIAKPSDIKFVGAYDYEFNIIWPKLSDKVNKIVVKFLDNGQEVVKEFTDFETPGKIETSEYGNYEFEIVTYSTTGKISNPVRLTALNKGFIIEEIISNPLIGLSDGIVDIKFFNPNEAAVKVKIIDPNTNEVLLEQFASSSSEINAYIAANDGTHEYLVELEDDKGRKTTRNFTYTFEYIVTTNLVVGYGSGNLEVANNTTSKISNLTVTYPLASGGTTTKSESFGSNKGTLSFVPIDGTHTITIAYEDEQGRKLSRNLTYTHLPYTFINFNTAALKQPWVVTVSSNATNDGTGPNALKDGLANTYWHTPWSGTILPWPHYFDITFNKNIQIKKFVLKIRHNNGNGSPKNFDLQVSQDGVTFTTHQTYVNSINAAGAVIPFDVTKPVDTKHVRLLFRDNIANSASMAIAEIDIEGNQNL